MDSSEFDLIRHYFAPLAAASSNAFGLLDDVCLLPPLVAGNRWVMTKDVMIAGVHFFADDPADLIAKKLLRTNLSDLAAKGAVARGYLLGLALPKHIEEKWIAKFAKGLAEDQATFDVALWGGDTTAHEDNLVLSLTAIGEVPEGKIVLRSGAKAGDRIFVSGTLGDSAMGLAMRQGKYPSHPALVQRYLLPEPRLELGFALRGIATSAMDISDGLVQDAAHIAKASGVKLTIRAFSVPVHAETVRLEPMPLELALAGGDDYELLFTVPPKQVGAVRSLAAITGIPLTEIGGVSEGKGVEVVNKAGKPLPNAFAGYQHF